MLAQVSAQARALARSMADQALSHRLLSRAAFEWAHPSKRFFPVQMARELSEHSNANPARVAYVLEEVEAIGRRKAEAGEVINPIAWIIGGLGAQREPKKPWEVPLAFAASFSKRADDYQRLTEAQQLINQRRNAQPSPQRGASAAGGT